MAKREMGRSVGGFCHGEKHLHGGRRNGKRGGCVSCIDRKIVGRREAKMNPEFKISELERMTHSLRVLPTLPED